MDSNTAIGNVDKFLLITTDNLGEKVETNISKGMTVNGAATYGQVDTAARAVAALSTYTYSDSILVTNISVNEIMAV